MGQLVAQSAGWLAGGSWMQNWPQQSGLSILYFPNANNSLCLPPQFSINYCCEMLLRGLYIPKTISQYFLQNLWGKQSELWAIGK